MDVHNTEQRAIQRGWMAIKFDCSPCTHTLDRKARHTRAFQVQAAHSFDVLSNGRDEAWTQELDIERHKMRENAHSARRQPAFERVG